MADGTFSRAAVNPETQRRKSAKAWEAKSEVAKVRHSLDLTQEDIAFLWGLKVDAPEVKAIMATLAPPPKPKEEKEKAKPRAKKGAGQATLG